MSIKLKFTADKNAEGGSHRCRPSEKTIRDPAIARNEKEETG